MRRYTPLTVEKDGRGVGNGVQKRAVEVGDDVVEQRFSHTPEVRIFVRGSGAGQETAGRRVRKGGRFSDPVAEELHRPLLRRLV